MSKPVIIESPYAGDIERNVRYARACMLDCLVNRNEAPYASHLLYTQPGVLDDRNPDQRMHGIEAGYSWWDVAELVVFYTDLGWSWGMNQALERCGKVGKYFEFRILPPDFWSE